jgi:hypothetical protein
LTLHPDISIERFDRTFLLDYYNERRIEKSGGLEVNKGNSESHEMTITVSLTKEAAIHPKQAGCGFQGLVGLF